MRKKLTGIIAAIRPARLLHPIVIGCLAFLAGSLLGIGASATAQDETNNVSLATPEEAITFFMQGVVQGDVSQIKQACAVDEMSAGFKFDLFVDYVQYLTLQTPAPSDYPFYAELNKAQFSGKILNQVKYLAYGLLVPENEVVEGRTVLMDTEAITQFMAAVDPARLAQLQIKQIGLPVPDIANSERNLGNWNRYAQLYEADEYTERVVLLLFEGDYYYMGFTLYRYGENWKISSATSTLANTTPLGVPEVTTLEEFQELVGGD